MDITNKILNRSSRSQIEHFDPKKITIINSWRIADEHLPTPSVNLDRKGIHTSGHSLRREICEAELETETHFILKYNVAIDLFSKI